MCNIAHLSEVSEVSEAETQTRITFCSVLWKSALQGSKRGGMPRRGAVKEKIFANIINGIRSLSRSSSEAAGGAEPASPCGDQHTGHSGPMDTSMMVKAS
ncbi:unnamed protein product [Calypogeia fissa]